MQIPGFRNREHFYKRLFLLADLLRRFYELAGKLALFSFGLASLSFLFLFLYDLGFRTGTAHEGIIYGYWEVLTVLFWSKCLLEANQIRRKSWRSILLMAVILFVVFLNLAGHWNYLHLFPNGGMRFLRSKTVLSALSFVLIFSEMFRLNETLNKLRLSAQLLFAGSFLVIILTGTGLLLMPNATYGSISLTDALFTATSAVCVTGLVVVDTALTFTPFGKAILLFLIQIGGLGIMAFTGFFGFMFTGTASLEEHFMLKELFSAEKLGGMFKLLFRIIAVTFAIELAGTLAIYFSIPAYPQHRMAYAVFHAISAFCNAGFTIFPVALSSPELGQNRLLQLVLAGLIILGGIGFPVLLHGYLLGKHHLKGFVARFFGSWHTRKPPQASTGLKLALWTTLFLLLAGTLAYYFMERRSVSPQDGFTSRLIVSFFGSVSARTAGFNIVDISHWTNPTLWIMILLMWIGASPGSTGGGIKTTTFAVSVLAVFRIATGRRIETARREISSTTIAKVLVTVFLSLFTIFTVFLLLLVAEPAKNPVHLLFECVSAFSTVGLSIADTATLKGFSKYLLVILMYVGRISPLILLSGLMMTKKNVTYRLPEENLAIN
jgi:trk system potassium uptake protein